MEPPPIPTPETAVRPTQEPARDSTAIRKSNESTSIRKPKQP